MKHQIQYGTSVIDFTLEYAARKTLGIRVHPDKSVQVIAPIGASQQVIEKKVKSKAAWIQKQQDFFLSFYPHTPPRRYLSGETHLYLGKQYRLKLIQSKEEQVKLIGGRITVFTADTTNKEKIEQALKQWYTQKAQTHFPFLFDKLLPKAQSFYEGTPQLKYRWMKKRWGSCHKNGQILLNIELIKAPKKCIEYVIMHEFCHLAHLNHSRAFYDLLEKHYPDWKKTKDYLEHLMV